MSSFNWSKSKIRQYYAALSVNLLSVAYGASYGWVTSSYLDLGKAETSHLDKGALSLDDFGWVAASLFPGALVGTILLGFLADRIGRKRTLLLMAIPMLVNWILILTARDLIAICVARFLGGCVGGCCFTVIPVYITELAEDRFRSTLGTFLPLGCTVGLLLVNTLGYYFHYIIVAWAMLAMPLAFVACFVFNPETPQYLALRSLAEAEKSLRYYRGLSSTDFVTEQVSLELNALGQLVGHKKTGKYTEDGRPTWQDFKQPKAIKANTIVFGLVLINQFTGCFALLNYLSLIFKEAGSSLSPLASTIIVIVIQLAGTYASTLFVECMGRKPCMLLSTIGIFLGQIALASYYYLTALGYRISAYGWIPIASLSVILFAGSFGVMAVSFVLMAEITPPKIRSASMRVQMTLLFLFASLIIKVFPYMKESLGIPGVVTFFAVFSFLGTIFIAVYVPETKGKSIEEIQRSL